MCPSTKRPPSPAELPWAGNAEGDRLIAANPFALLIGFALDQQVPIEKAFSAPQVILERLGTLDPARIAATPADEFERVCTGPPAVHRFPGAMARRIQALAAIVAGEYGGHAERVWTEATSGAQLRARIAALPGFGPMKATTLSAVLVKRFGITPPGWEALLPEHMTLADVVDADTLRRYRELKRERKLAAAEAKA